jgi:hypothetical protein
VAGRSTGERGARPNERGEQNDARAAIEGEVDGAITLSAQSQVVCSSGNRVRCDPPDWQFTHASARVGGEFVTIRGRRNFCVHLRIAEILKAEAIGVRWYQREQRFT